MLFCYPYAMYLGKGQDIVSVLRQELDMLRIKGINEDLLE